MSKTGNSSAGNAAVVLDMARHAPDRYLSALLAPRQAREGLMAIAAFGAEIRQIPDAVREPLAGEIRLQWWRDTLTAGNPVGHPVADAFMASMQIARLPAGLAIGQIDAIGSFLDREPFADAAALRSHLAKTEGAAFSLAAQILGAGQTAQVQAAATAAGMAYGMARLLHDLPAELAKGRMLLPATLLAEAGVTPEDPQLEAAPALTRAALDASIAKLAQETAGLHRTAVDHILALPRALRPAFLPLALVPTYLALASSVPDRLRQQRPLQPLTRIWRLWSAQNLGRF